MALKSTYTIDVDDSQFLEFKKAFDEHQQSMQDMVAAWGQISTSITGAVTGADELLPLLEQQIGLLMDIRDNQTATTEEVEKQESAFDRMRRSTKDVLSNIGGMTVNLLKWTSISGIVTGLAGVAAGGFGLGFLAQNAGQQRYTARGMGVSSGAVNAFDVDYAPFGNGQALLGSVSDAQTSNADAWRFTANGLDPRGDTVENSLSLQQSARDVYRQSGGDLTNLQQSLAARGLDKFFSVQDARRLGSASDEEFSGMQSNIRRDTRDLGASDSDLRNWQELNRQVDRAKTSIENTFIQGLAPLTPELTNLSRDLNGLIKDVLADPHIKEAIQEFGNFLEEIDKELKSGQLADRFHQFSDLLAEAIQKISPYIHVAQTVDRDVNYVSNVPNEVRSLAHPTYDPDHSPFWKNLHAVENRLWPSSTDEKSPSPSPQIDHSPDSVRDPSHPYDEGKEALFWNHFRDLGKWLGIVGNAHAEGMPQREGDVGQAMGQDRENPLFQPQPNILSDDGQRLEFPIPDGVAQRNPSIPTGDKAPFWGNMRQAEDLLGYRSVSDGLLDAVAQVESNGGRNAGTSRAGARGMFQFMPATAAMYGITDRDNPEQEREGARRYINDLLKKYHGSAAEAVAAYNFGPGNLDKLMKSHRDDWEQYLPDETKNYVQKIAHELVMPTRKRATTSARQRSVLKVQIDNSTGTNVSVGARMAAR